MPLIDHKWAVVTHPTLFTPTGTHLYNGEVVEKEEIDMEKVRL